METTTINTSTSHRIYYSQQCLCCNNTRRLPEGMTYCSTPWVCDECKEAIALMKNFKRQMNDTKAASEKQETEKQETPNENIYPL